ncbi:MAG: DUF4013 domain-containing protein [Halorubrum sp.]|uniref:DUF4013 domain-containing protein n=1 Tax=Halorubrum sp. TaxID=1879286 RepID=UPI003970FE22
MLRGAISALSRSTDSVGVLVVGGLLTLLTWVVTPVWVVGVLAFPPLLVLLPLALAPAFVARGYLVRVVAGGGATGNRAGVPSFVAWNELYRDGLKSALLSALLLAPLAVLLAVVAAVGTAAGAGLVGIGPALGAVERALGPDGVPAVLGAGGGLLAVVAAAYLLAFAYVRPAALAAFAASGRLRDGLRPGRVAAVAGSGAYATAWAVAIATLGAGYALAAPLVPLVVGVAIVFVARVVAHALYGHGAAGAVEFGTAEPVASPTGVAAPDSPSDRADQPSGRAAPVSDRLSPSPDRPDGGFRRSIPEPPAAVQTGRTVPIGHDAGDANAGGANASDPAGFRWDVDVEAGGDDDRATPTDDDFEWGAGDDPENKS